MTELTSVQKKWRKKKIYSWTGAALVAGIVLILNAIVGFIPLRLDTSEGRIYSISKGSKELVHKLDDILLIRVFFSSKLPPQFKINEQYIKDLLHEYKRASGGKIRLEYLDPSKNNKIRQQAVLAGVAPVQLDVRERDRREVKECFMGITFQFGTQTDAIAFIQNTQGLEYEISQRIKKLINPEDIRIGVVNNSNAFTFDLPEMEDLKGPLDQLYTLETLDLTRDDIPADLNALWLIGPKEKLDDGVIQKMESWVEQGGALGLLIDRYNINTQSFRATEIETGLENLLEKWGVSFDRALVADRQSDRIQIQSQRGYIRWVNVVEYPYFPLTTDLNRDHPATKGIDGVSLPFVSPFKIEKNTPNLTYTPLFNSSDQSWLNKKPDHLSPLEQYAPKEDEKKGPFILGLIIEGPFSSEAAAGQTGRVILIGTSKFIRTDYPPRKQNFSLFINLLDWSAQDETLLSIRSKGAAIRPLKNLNDGARLTIKYMIMLFLPILSILIGIIVWRREKMARSLIPLQYADS